MQTPSGTIVVIDYGMGNVSSIANMLKKAGARAKISSSPDELLAADRLILPGVGAFDQGMRRLAERGLIPVLERKVLGEGAPLLGICLGMQLLTRRSEEGQSPGLGWIEADTVRFDFGANPERLKVPHMAWNVVLPSPGAALFTGFDGPPRFYFVHSYHAVCDRAEDVLATSWHGYEFACAIGRGPIAGTQFHPEKSHRFGLTLLRNFAASLAREEIQA
jgi:glutamine amidotransferase